MAGLLDYLSGNDGTGAMNDPSTMGLLGAAAGIFNASGPSRTPVSLGQVLGQGFQGYTNGIKQASDADTAKQVALIRAAQLQGLQGELGDKELQRQRDLQLRQFYINQATGQDSSQSGGGLSGSGIVPAAGASAADVLTGGGTATGPSATGTAPLTTTPGQQLGIYQQKLQQAAALRKAGFPAEADAAEKAAIAFKPKFATEPRVVRGPDGNPMLIQMADDGTVTPVNGYGVAEKLNFTNTGGSTQGLDPYTGKPMAVIKNTQSPDNAATNAVTMRGQNMVDARAEKDTQDPAQVENIAQMIASGRMAPLGQMAMRSPIGAAVMSRVSEINPNFRAQDFGTGSKAEKDFATGKQGNSVRSFNVGLAHLDTLSSLADALNNKDTQGINKIGNYFSAQTGNPAPTNFDAAKKVVADEIVKAIVGSGGGVADREEAARVISGANSPAQLKGVISTYKQLMNGQLNGLEQQYKTTTGRDDFNKYLSPEAQGARDAGHGAALAAPALPSVTPQPIRKSAIKGQILNGYRFKGGDPADQNSWEKM